MSAALRVGISTCPNDTFAFHGLLSGAVSAAPLSLDFRLADVQELNEALLAGSLDVVKASFHAALLASEDYVVLEAGSALGFGVGPLLLAGASERSPVPNRVLCPGEWTTATMLYRLYHPDEGDVEHVLFSDILPALAAGRARRGVCIHEGRFTYRDHGLRLVEDLGERWERDTGAPLPLGGILARRSLGPKVLAAVQRAIGASLDHAGEHPADALVTMRRHAAEQGDEVLMGHVELYVNAWTRDLGAEGRAALAVLGRRARAAGLVGTDASPLEVFGG
ncbi:MAG: 1,4-dihydroxy-6-naphthoate synthase [Planctomycetota bacterium]|nr:1,4-dihydroxy-6-naphthoate synthase [Planctomycetota bacterium]